MSDEHEVRDTRLIETEYWSWMVAFASLLAGVAIFIDSPPLLLCASLPIVYAGYASFDREPPPVEHLRLDRELDEGAFPRERVDVSVTITNDSDRFLPDVSVVDGVPTAFEVIDGSARAAGSIRPGHSLRLDYSVSVTRGEHAWEPTTVVLGNRSGSKERQGTIEADASIERRLSEIAPDDVPLRELNTRYGGLRRTDRGGSGIEFYGTRAYKHGDPIRRIDWKRFARTRELGTVQYHEEGAAAVLLLIDARKAAYRSPSPGSPHAVDRSVEAAGRIFSALLDSGNRAGFAAFGRDDVWLAPGAGSHHLARGQHLLAYHSALSRVPPERARYGSLLEERREELLADRVKHMRHGLPSATQVFFLTPCTDSYPVTVAHYLNTLGHLVTVLSPDPTTAGTPGRYLDSLAREHRLALLSRIGIRVLDWAADEPLESALLHVTPAGRTATKGGPVDG